MKPLSYFAGSLFVSKGGKRRKKRKRSRRKEKIGNDKGKKEVNVVGYVFTGQQPVKINQ